MKKLIIAEKPSLALKIVQALETMKKHDGYYENDKYIVTFAFGHLLVLYSLDDYFNREKTPWKMDELPFIPEQFKYRLQDDAGIKKQYNVIKELYQRKDILSIINAGDPDREGSVIILNIINRLQKETNQIYSIERIWLKATHPEYVRQALNDLHQEEYYGNLYEEGLARTYIDWLYGINYTRYVSIKGNTFLPVGRVLIPIVKYIYDRDKEIEQFKPSTYYEIECDLIKDNNTIRCTIEDTKSDTFEVTKSILNKIKNKLAYVQKVNKKEIIKHPPKLFSLDTLQNKMSNEYKYPSAKTLEIVQSLYEKGYVTYPRTNSEYLAESEKKVVQTILKSIELPLTLKETKSIFDDTKIEGHSALIITTKKPDLESLDKDQQLIYKTIYNRFISNFLDEQTIVEKSTVKIAIESYDITLNGTIIKQQGFYKYEKPLDENLLPQFEENEEVNIRNLEVLKKQTKAPTRITESDLNKYLKNPYKTKDLSENDDEEYKNILLGCEIGTVATRATIIQNALKYEYIKREKNHLRITDKGKYLIEILSDLNIKLDKDSTVKINMSLKEIFRKQNTIEKLLENTSQELQEIILRDTNNNIKAYQKAGLCKCPKCKTGEILLGKTKDNYYCSNYKNCSFSIRIIIAQKKLTETQIKTLIEKGSTGIIKGFTSTKTGKKFDARLKLGEDMEIKFIFNK